MPKNVFIALKTKQRQPQTSFFVGNQDRSKLTPPHWYHREKGDLSNVKHSGTYTEVLQVGDAFIRVPHKRAVLNHSRIKLNTDGVTVM